MKSKTKLFYFSILAVYLMVTVFFFVLHVLSRQRIVLHNFGNLEVYGYISRLNSPMEKNPLEIGLNLGNFSIRFSDKLPLFCVKKDGSELKDRVISYAMNGNALDMFFENKIKLRVTLIKENEYDLSFTDSGTGLLNDLNTLQIPLYMMSKDALERIHDSLYSSVYRKKRFFLGFSGADNSIYADNKLVLTPDQGSLSIILAETDGNANPNLYWLSRNPVCKDTAQFEKIAASYFDAAYAAWMGTRFSTRTGKWDFNGGEPSFDEQTGMAMLSESIVRGDYVKALYLYNLAFTMERNRENGPDLPSVTSCYIGKLESYLKHLMEQDAEDLPSIEKMIARADPLLLDNGKLVLTLLNHGNILYLDDFISKVVIPYEMTPKNLNTCLAMAGMYLDVNKHLKNKVNYFSRFRTIPYSNLIPAIVNIKEGLFQLPEGKKRIDTLQSLKTARLFIDFGTAEKEPLYVTIGTGMIVSVLAYTDDQGYIPEYFTVEGNKLVKSESTLPPERVYPVISQNPYQPKELPLYPELDPGKWMMAAAILVNVASMDDEIKLLLKFPPGYRHYFFIRNINPVAEVIMHGKKVFMGENYFAFPDGAYYSGEFQSLLVKLKHENEVEEVTIRYKKGEINP
ncbi:MAG: hypothetical protein JW969_20730 [Spirochaetales bacterium]|nr:hypothetical protein [Spirochaetales bacterium]